MMVHPVNSLPARPILDSPQMREGLCPTAMRTVWKATHQISYGSRFLLKYCPFIEEQKWNCSLLKVQFSASVCRKGKREAKELGKCEIFAWVKCFLQCSFNVPSYILWETSLQWFQTECGKKWRLKSRGLASWVRLRASPTKVLRSPASMHSIDSKERAEEWQ